MNDNSSINNYIKVARILNEASNDITASTFILESNEDSISPDLINKANEIVNYYSNQLIDSKSLENIFKDIATFSDSLDALGSVKENNLCLGFEIIPARSEDESLAKVLAAHFILEKIAHRLQSYYHKNIDTVSSKPFALVFTISKAGEIAHEFPFPKAIASFLGISL